MRRYALYRVPILVSRMRSLCLRVIGPRRPGIMNTSLFVVYKACGRMHYRQTSLKFGLLRVSRRPGRLFLTCTLKNKLNILAKYSVTRRFFFIINFFKPPPVDEKTQHFHLHAHGHQVENPHWAESVCGRLRTAHPVEEQSINIISVQITSKRRASYRSTDSERWVVSLKFFFSSSKSCRRREIMKWHIKLIARKTQCTFKIRFQLLNRDD